MGDGAGATPKGVAASATLKDGPCYRHGFTTPTRPQTVRRRGVPRGVLCKGRRCRQPAGLQDAAGVVAGVNDAHGGLATGG
jgi:hypothetical protein